MRRCAVLFLVFAALCSCGGGGGRSGGADEALTEEEEQAAQVSAELSPENRDIPDEVVPDVYQGKRLLDVRLELEAESFAGFEGSRLYFCLCPGGEVSDALIRKDGKVTVIHSAKWEGQSAGVDAGAVAWLTVSGVDEDGADFSLNLENLNVAGKTVNGQQTIYVGSVTGGTCTLGGAMWHNFLGGGTAFRMTYDTVGGN